MKVCGHKRWCFFKAFYTDPTLSCVSQSKTRPLLHILSQVHSPLSILKIKTIEVAISLPNYLQLA